MKKNIWIWILFVSILTSCTDDTEDIHPPEHSTSNEHWVSERYNNSNTGYTENRAPKSLPNVKWKTKSNLGQVGQPVVHNGVVYFGSLPSSSLYAVDMNSGNEIWKYTHDEQFVVYFSCPTVSDETVYFGTSDVNWDANSSNFLYAIDTKSGIEKWKFSANGSVVASPKVENGVVYFGTTNGYVYALDASTGVEKWSFLTDGEVLKSPAIANGTMIIGSTFNIYAIDINTGQEKWNKYTGNAIKSSPAISGGKVYYGIWRYLYVYDVNTGNEIWKFKKDNDSFGWINSPAITTGVVYFTDSHNTLYAVAKTTGQQIWKFHEDRTDVSNSDPVVSNGFVYVAFGSREFYAIDLFTGTEQWKYDTGGDYEITGSAAISDGMLIFTMDDNIIALE